MLYVPSPLKELPQVLTASSVLSAINLVAFNQNRAFCVVANSLLAQASVNHLHYHGLYIEEDYFAKHVGGVKVLGTCYYLPDCPVPGYGFTGSSVKQVAKEVYRLVQVLLEKGIPHNMTIVWGKHFELGEHSNCVRVLLFPRKPVYGMKNLFGEDKEKPLFFQAALELGGFVPVMDESRFDSITEKEIIDVLNLVALEKGTLQEVEASFKKKSWSN